MLYFILIVSLVAVGLLIFVALKINRAKGSATDNQALAALGEQNRELREIIAGLRQEMQETNRHQFTQTTNLVQAISREAKESLTAVTEKLTKLDETNKQVVNFSAQLQNLQDILKNPKQRGVLGEYFLEEILKNVLPPGTYQMQYKFKDGVIVDAVVFVKDKIIPIDSKFSLENYEKILNAADSEAREKLEKQFKQDLKNRIDESAKYIKPSENTLDFAFMFIPSEAIYYDLLVNKVGAVQINTRDLIEYAFIEKRVIIVSPTSFLAYLQTVLQGLKAMQIEEGAKEILANVEKLGRHLNAYDEFMKKVGASLATTVNHYNSASKEFKKVDKDVAKIAGKEAEVETILIDKPNLE